MSFIQPGALQAYASKLDLETGFLGRFLVAEMPAGFFGCPVVGELATETAACIAALDTLRLKDCDIRPPNRYNAEPGALFLAQKAEPGPTWRRLASEYYPRFAAILSVKLGDDSPQIEITPDAWQRAAVMTQYFFAQAEAVLTNIRDDQTVNRFEALCRRILTIIDNHPGGCPLSDISRLCGAGTRSKERHEALNELVTRGVITTAKVQGVTTFARA